jgi:hypothetical protein
LLVACKESMGSVESLKHSQRNSVKNRVALDTPH